MESVVSLHKATSSYYSWDVMVHSFLLCAATLMLVGVTTPRSASEAAQGTDRDVRAFLVNIAGEQLFEVSLGQLAAQRARNPRVKELAALVVEDHRKASRQLERLASQEGVTLSHELRQDDQRMIEQLSQLSGDTFDREYVKYLLQDHEKTVEVLEREMPMVQDGAMRHWVISMIPLLESHRISARVVKYALKPNP